jgi:hypothetical protein
VDLSSPIAAVQESPIPVDGQAETSSVRLQGTQSATGSGGGSLTCHTPEGRVRLGRGPIWQIRKNVVTP